MSNQELCLYIDSVDIHVLKLLRCVSTAHLLVLILLVCSGPFG